MPFSLVRPDVLYAWKGPSLLIVDVHGECGNQPWTGYYFREARFLSTLRLEVNGEQPTLCEAATVAPDSLALNYVHPDVLHPGGGGTGQAGDEQATDAHGIAARSLDLRLLYRMGVAELSIELVIGNRARQRVSFELAWRLAADFADIQEAQAGTREQQAHVGVVEHEHHLEFAYGHPDLPLRAQVHHDRAFTRRGDRLVADVSLAPQQERQIVVRVVPVPLRDPIAMQDATDRGGALARWQARFTRVAIPGNRVAQRVIDNNVRDMGSLALLDGAPDEWLALQAGMPLYPAFFGRDAVTAGWQAGYVDCGESLAATLRKLGRSQSARVDDWHDEQPGRIPQQMRRGPLALLGLNPFAAYYADYASPLMFVISLANLWAWTGDRRHLDEHWDTARRLLDWARRYGDMDGDGYLEYHTRSTSGPKNQGWKDSGDAIVYDDGSQVSAPIATCELQGYWYVAQALMALMANVRGENEDARAHRENAEALKAQFNRDWWMPAEGFYALALDPDKRQVRALTSNVGHCLACGIIDSEHLPGVVGRMFAPDLFSGWGVRTLSTTHAFYDPLSYHRGSVWAVEQATIAFGLRRFGFDERAQELALTQFELAQLYPEDRIPECVGGYARAERPVPGAYPRANTPQLWNATAFPLLVQTMLGLVAVAPARTLVVDPVLPFWLPEIVVRDLRVGAAKVTLRFWRETSGKSRWQVLHKQGTLHIVRQPPPESLSATWSDRTMAVLASLLH